MTKETDLKMNTVQYYYKKGFNNAKIYPFTVIGPVYFPLEPAKPIKGFRVETDYRTKFFKTLNGAKRYLTKLNYQKID
jgi:hypothetical protein